MARIPITEDQIQGLCVLCNKNLQSVASKSTLGFKRYAKHCSSCHKFLHGNFSTREKNRQNKKPHCERCGFVASDLCQLDIHHKDRNRKNNLLSNLETLCSNCHRLEHVEERKLQFLSS